MINIHYRWRSKAQQTENFYHQNTCEHQKNYHNWLEADKWWKNKIIPIKSNEWTNRKKKYICINVERITGAVIRNSIERFIASSLAKFGKIEFSLEMDRFRFNGSFWLRINSISSALAVGKEPRTVWTWLARVIKFPWIQPHPFQIH